MGLEIPVADTDCHAAAALDRLELVDRLPANAGSVRFFLYRVALSCLCRSRPGSGFRGIIEDVLKRPYITLGMAGLLMLIPLAVTSTKGMMRRLGKRWQKLHRLVYVIAVVAVWHFYWQVKLDTLEPAVYALCWQLLAAVWFSYEIPARARR